MMAFKINMLAFMSIILNYLKQKHHVDTVDNHISKEN